MCWRQNQINNFLVSCLKPNHSNWFTVGPPTSLKSCLHSQRPHQKCSSVASALVATLWSKGHFLYIEYIRDLNSSFICTLWQVSPEKNSTACLLKFWPIKDKIIAPRYSWTPESWFVFMFPSNLLLSYFSSSTSFPSMACQSLGQARAPCICLSSALCRDRWLLADEPAPNSWPFGQSNQLNYIVGTLPFFEPAIDWKDSEPPPHHQPMLPPQSHHIHDHHLHTLVPMPSMPSSSSASMISHGGVPIHMVLNPEPHLRPMVTPPSTPAIPGNPRSKRHGTTIFVERLPNRSSSSMMTSLACRCDWTPSARFGHHWLQWSTSCRRRTLQSRSPGMFRSTLTSWIFDGTIARVTLSACATPTCHILHTHRPQCRQQDTGTLFPPRPFTDFNQPYIMLHLAIEPFPLGTYHKMLDRRKIPSIHVVLQFPFYFFLLPCCCLVCIHLIPISALFSSEIWQSETPQPPI